MPNPNSDVIEAMARAMRDAYADLMDEEIVPWEAAAPYPKEAWIACAHAALTAAEPLIRQHAFEEAAGIVEQRGKQLKCHAVDVRLTAAAIRTHAQQGGQSDGQ